MVLGKNKILIYINSFLNSLLTSSPSFLILLLDVLVLTVEGHLDINDLFEQKKARG